MGLLTRHDTRVATVVVAASDSRMPHKADIICDGVDDHIDIQAAIVRANGGSVYLAEGTFNLGATVNLNIDGTTIFGAGKNVTVVNAPNFCAFNVTSAGCAIHDVDILGVRGGGANEYAIWLNAGAQRFLGYNFRAQLFETGLRVTSGVFHFFHDCELRNISGCVVFYDGSNDLSLSRIAYDTDTGVYAEPGGGGIYIQNGDAMVVSDCDFIHAGVGFHMRPTASPHGWHLIQNSYFDSCANAGIHIANASALRGVLFDGVWSATNARGLVVEDGAHNALTFSGCHFHNNEFEGARIMRGAAVLFRGCEFAGNSSSGVGAADNVYVDSPDGLVEFSGCFFGRAFSWASTPGRHLNIGVNAVNVLALDNEFDSFVNVAVASNAGVLRCHRVFEPVQNPNGNIGQHPAVVLTDGADVAVQCPLHVPPKFHAVIRAAAIVVPGGNGNMRRSVATNYGKLHASEAYNTHSGAIAAGEVAVTLNRLESISILAAIPTLNQNDLVGVQFARLATSINDTVGADCYLLGIDLEYV